MRTSSSSIHYGSSTNRICCENCTMQVVVAVAAAVTLVNSRGSIDSSTDSCQSVHTHVYCSNCNSAAATELPITSTTASAAAVDSPCTHTRVCIGTGTQ
jgi:hypothetical protein